MQKKAVIVKESIIDRKGNIHAICPEDVPEFANRCKAVSETIRTGQEHKVVSA